MANLFIRFLGIKGTMKLGPTGFRTFIRNCKLSGSSLSMAAVDILYIDITRRWNSMALDQRDSVGANPYCQSYKPGGRLLPVHGVVGIKSRLSLMGELQPRWPRSPSKHLGSLPAVVVQEVAPWGAAPAGSCEVRGMCLQAFVEAFFFLAQRKFKLLPLHEQVASLIDLCEYHLSMLDEKRLASSRGGLHPQGGPPGAGSPQLAGGNPPPRTCGANRLGHPRHALS
nr:tubulin polyglutamylase TTLL11 isoform X2 [Oryctolagus cuniculus]